MKRYVFAIVMVIVLVMTLAVPTLAEQGKAQGAVKGDLTNSEGDVGGFAIASTQHNMGAILCVHVDIPTLGGQTVLVFANGGDKGAIILDGQGKGSLHVKWDMAELVEPPTVVVCVTPVLPHVTLLDYLATLAVPVNNS